MRMVLLASTVLAGVGRLDAQAQEAGAGSTILPQIVVEGASYETEGSESYSTNEISVGEKDVRSWREIPQTTTVLTRERLEDGNFTSLDTALRKTPGLVVLDNDNGRSSILSRGFEFDKLYFNGLPAPLSSIYGTQPDMAIVDHVEILQGPAGLFGGAGEPAGAINMRLKQARDTFQARFEGSAGSWNTGRGEIDVTGPLDPAGTIRGRFVGALQDGDSWIEGGENGVGVAYGTLQADLTDNTKATFSISHMQRDIAPFNGLPTAQDGTLLDLDRSTTTGADWNRFDNSVTDYIAELEHRFDDGGHAKISARYNTTDVNFLYNWANGYVAPTGDIIAARGGDNAWLARDLDQTSLALDAHVSKPFEMFGQEHNFILGADYQNINSTLFQARGTINVDQNIYDWDTGIPEPDVIFPGATDATTSQYGIYGQLRVKPFDPLTLIGGTRMTWLDQTQDGSTDVDINGQFTPYAGVVYDVTDTISLYGSYTEIFLQQSAFDSRGELLGPQEGRQYEAGIKAELFDGRMNASLGYFNLRALNRAEPVRGTSYANAADVEVQGFDLQASGEITSNFRLMAGYTYTQTEYLTTSAAGTPFNTYTPEHMFQLWGNYTFDERHGALNGFFIGGGLKAFSEFSSGSIEAPGYVTVDLMAGYQINEHLAASLTINNLFDEKYYSRVGGPTVFNFYGEPLSATFKVSSTF